MYIKKEIEKIHNYFDALNVEEFEEVLERNGINEIKNREYGYGSDIKEVSLYTCPKCGTIKMEE